MRKWSIKKEPEKQEELWESKDQEMKVHRREENWYCGYQINGYFGEVKRTIKL